MGRLKPKERAKEDTVSLPSCSCRRTLADGDRERFRGDIEERSDPSSQSYDGERWLAA